MKDADKIKCITGHTMLIALEHKVRTLGRETRALRAEAKRIEREAAACKNGFYHLRRILQGAPDDSPGKTG